MNQKIKIFIFISLFILFQISIYPQNNKANSILNIQTENKKEKSYWLPAGQVLVINTLVLLKARYMENEHWSKISFSSVENNFRKGFVWDDNTFGMNQFLHPYHGSAYFNAARSNGLSFWESAPYVFGGSLIWELAFEVELPAYNDLINTTLSGIILGEISHRISNQIIDESTIGFERFTREFTSFIINPVQGLNRLVKGKMWNHGIKQVKPNLFTRISFGITSLFINRTISESYAYFLFGVDFDYGKKFAASSHKKPFDYINVYSEFSFTNGDNIFGVSASGVLWDWKFKEFDTNKNIAGLYKEFDYFENIVYKFTATSLTGEVTNKTIFSNNSSLQSSVGLSAIFLGGTNSIHSKEVLMNYNLGPGMGVRIFIDAQLSEDILLSFKYKQFWIYIVNGLEGNEFIGLFNLEFNYKLFKTNSLGLSFVLYERYGIYSDYSDEHSENASVRIFTRFYL